MKKIALVADRDDLLRLLKLLQPNWTQGKLYKRVSKCLDSFISNFVQIAFKHITTQETENPV